MAGSNNQLVFCTVLLCTLYSTYVHLLNSETSNKRLQSITVARILTIQCLLYLKKEQIHFLKHEVHAKLCNKENLDFFHPYFSSIFTFQALLGGSRVSFPAVFPLFPAPPL